MRNSKLLFAARLLAVAVFFSACASAPDTEMTEAQTSLNDARNAAQADTWAPEDFQAAQQSFDAAQAEVEMQNERFSMTRDFDKAREMFTQAKADAERAKRAAITNKETIKVDADENLQLAMAAVDSARQALDRAPRTKGTRADIALFSSDLEGLDRSLEDVSTMISSQDYKRALARASAITQEAEEMTGKLTQAAMRTGR